MDPTIGAGQGVGAAGSVEAAQQNQMMEFMTEGMVQVGSIIMSNIAQDMISSLGTEWS